MVKWIGGDYYLGAKIEKSDDWLNVDHLGEKGWEFVAVLPNHKVYSRNSFDKEILNLVRLAVFKRQMEEHEEMRFDVDRAN